MHRASNVTSVGFAWSELPAMIALTEKDRRVLELARSEGIGEGFTVPAYVPGEAHGSCSFACAAGDPFASDNLALLQLVGAFAFEAARRMRREQFAKGPVFLTDRQRECLMWAARGKSDWEIAQILIVGKPTSATGCRMSACSSLAATPSAHVSPGLIAGTCTNRGQPRARWRTIAIAKLMRSAYLLLIQWVGAVLDCGVGMSKNRVALRRSLSDAVKIDQNMLRYVLDQSRDCIKILGPSGDVTYINSEGRCALEITNVARFTASPGQRCVPPRRSRRSTKHWLRRRPARAARLKSGARI